jgi:hypothetical protein
MFFKTLPKITVSIAILTLVFSVNAHYKFKWSGETWKYSQKWSKGKWGDTLEATVFTLNSKNKPVSIITYTKDTTVIHTKWRIKQKEIVTFNADDTTVQSKMMLQYYSDPAPYDTTITTYTYNSNNQLVSSSECKVKGDNSYVYVTDMWYDGNRIAGDSTIHISRESNPPNPIKESIIRQQKFIYTYTESAFELAEFVYASDSKPWMLIGKDTLVHDSLNRILIRKSNADRDSCIYSGNTLTEVINFYTNGEKVKRTMYMSSTPPVFLTENVVKTKDDFTHSYNRRSVDNRQFDLRGRYIGNKVKKTDAFLIQHKRSNTSDNMRIK